MKRGRGLLIVSLTVGTLAASAPALAQETDLEALVRTLSQAGLVQSQSARGMPPAAQAGEIQTLNLRRDLDGCPRGMLVTLNGRRLADDVEASWIDHRIAPLERELDQAVHFLESARCKLAVAQPRMPITPSQRALMERDLQLLPQLIVDGQALRVRLREAQEAIDAGGDAARYDPLRQEASLWTERSMAISRERSRLTRLARQERMPVAVPRQTLP